MKSPRPRSLRYEFAGRLQVSAILVAAGLGTTLATFYWNHPLSLFVFLCIGSPLTGLGIVIYLWSIVTQRNDAPERSRRTPGGHSNPR